MPNLRRAQAALAITLSLGVAAIGPGPAEAAVAHRTVNASHIRPGHVAWIRSGPGIAYKKVGYLRATSRHIRTMECKTIARDNWCHVQFQGTRGWIQDRYLQAPHVMRG